MRTAFLALSLFCFTVARAQSPQAIAAYVQRYKDIAIEEMKMYGIPASITLAQGIHESGCGCSALALNSNNHFGIKCHDEWSGQTYHHDDDLPQECFRVYNCPEESFRDHSEFLKTRSRYASLFTLAPGDYKAWAKGLKAAGYATNPRYPEIIIGLIETYKLDQYDRINGQTIVPKPEDNPEVQLIKQSLAQSAAPGHLHTADTIRTTVEERSVNGVRATVYRKEIPIAFIAQKYNLTVQQLYDYNDMATGDHFRDNDLVYLEHKKSESPYHQYEVSEGETMHDIAQKFGVDLSSLIKRNGVLPGCEPVAGEIIVLRGKREIPMKFRLSATTYPGKTSVQTTSPTDTRIHRVGTSETLYSIARQYNIPVDTLMRINGLKDEDIKIGQTLIVSL